MDGGRVTDALLLPLQDGQLHVHAEGDPGRGERGRRRVLPARPRGTPGIPGAVLSQPRLAPAAHREEVEEGAEEQRQRQQGRVGALGEGPGAAVERPLAR